MWYVRPAKAQSLCLTLEHTLTVKLLTEHHLAFLIFKRACTGSSWSTHAKMPHCWKSHVMAQILKKMRSFLFQVHACLKTAVSKLNTSSKHGYASYATTYSVDHSRGRMESLNKKNHATNYVPMKDIHLKFSNGDV